MVVAQERKYQQQATTNQLCSSVGGQVQPQLTTASAQLWATYSADAARSPYQAQIIGQDCGALIDRPNELIATASQSSSSSQSQSSGRHLSAGNARVETTQPIKKTSLFNSLISLEGVYSRRSLIYLLVASLLTSVANTFLLSVVVKSIQSHDKGFINGRLTWDGQSNSTLVHLPARVVSDKSILANAIESFGDKPLRLVVDRPLVGDKTDIHDGDQMQTASGYSPADQSADDGALFIAGLTLPTSTPSQQPTDDQPHDNQQAIDQEIDRISTSQSRVSVSELGALEINTDSLVMDVIDTTLDGILADQDKNGHLLNDKRAIDTNDIVMQDADYNEHLGSGKNRLLDFDSKSGSISLPMETHIPLNSAQANSLVCDHSLRCPKITGSLEEILDIQTRDANLICKSDGTLRLMAKSGSIKMTASDKLIVSANSLALSSPKNLYIPNGIEYFDSVEQPESLEKISANFDSKSATQQPAPSDNHQDHLSAVEELSAYNLIVVNGILMGSAI